MAGVRARLIGTAAAVLGAAGFGLGLGALAAGEHAPAPTGTTLAGAGAVTPATTAASTATSPPSSDPASAAGWLDRARLRAAVAVVAADTGASVGVAIRSLAGGATARAGTLQRDVAWSTIKVPIVLARYRLEQVDRRADLDQLARAAITASDNAAAQQLFDGIAAALGGPEAASRAVEDELREAGDGRTHVVAVQVRPPFSAYGQTSWTLAAGTGFYAALVRHCVGTAGLDARVLSWMAQVVPEQRWGLPGAARPRGWRVALKGGWGPDPAGRYLVRQFGLVTGPGGRGVAVGLMARTADGGFADGTAVLGALARASLGAVRWTRLGPPAACGRG